MIIFQGDLTDISAKKEALLIMPAVPCPLFVLSRSHNGFVYQLYCVPLRSLLCPGFNASGNFERNSIKYGM